MSALLDAALNYAKLGWKVFPLVPGQKRPLTMHGSKDATSNPDQIRAWWTQNPDANIGVATGSVSGIVVLDVDCKNDKDGYASLRNLDITQEDTLCQSTPSGGLHLVFQYLPEIRNSVDKLGIGLDTRGDGGYIAVFPSVVEGKPYAWLTSPFEGPTIASVPEALLAKHWNTPAQQRVDPEIAKNGAPHGCRQENLKDIVALYYKNNSFPIARAMAQVWGSLCDPKLTEKEVDTCCDNQERWRNGHEAQEPLTLDGMDEVEEPIPVLPESAMIGLAREFRDLYCEHFEAPRVFWYFSFLTFFGAAISKKVRLASGTEEPPRLYTVLLGTSGRSRKSSAMDATEDFFRRVIEPAVHPGQDSANERKLLVLHGSGSAEALARRIVRDENRPILMKFDELKSLIDKGRAEGSQLLPLLANVWGKGRWSNETLTYSVELQDAAISILAACTLGTFESAFRGTEADIGLLNRIWLVPGQTDKIIDVPSMPSLSAIEDLAFRVRLTIHFLTGTARAQVSFAPEARIRWRTWYTDFQRRTESMPSATRVDSYGLRLLTLLAVSDGPEPILGSPIKISLRLVEAVIEMLEWQLMMRERFYPIVADTAVAAMEEKIRKALGRRPGQWITRKRLIDFVNARRAGTGTLDKALEGLVRNAEIEQKSESHQFNKTTMRWYRSPEA
jgi:hypothetical protein